MDHRFSDVQQVRDQLASVDYLADDAIASVVHLSDRLEKPILIEGPAGTGKTQLAKSVAEMTGAENAESATRVLVASVTMGFFRLTMIEFHLICLLQINARAC